MAEQYAAEAPGGKFPDPWKRCWKGDQRDNPLDGTIPAERGAQMYALRSAVDRRNSVPIKKLTRTLFLLLSQVHEVGNLGQHQRDTACGQIDLGFMAANCFTAIQLAEQLTFALKP